ncbi:hydrogenase nickel incorporation protein HypB [Thermanaerothrix sp.]|jgi:hydrogenase nickel incorporation protein HypB|uniref:hydrogenase nickel incorporation protein HypB n=1 Tax=Thermanaerothrix sp. TaxID=2972675 RepID=UPI002ADDBA5C|nr:hydrogenase nickel incorporation protein HypB [Thermanaerothrix sp.]
MGNSIKVPVVEKLLDANDQVAELNRRLLDEARVLAINVMASPGAGKTSLILQTLRALSTEFRIAVIEGDTAPVTIDADKVSALGIPAVQINTGGDCHLDAVMLRAGLAQLTLTDLDLIIVENVGNLICPAAFKLGTHRNILVASIPEGDDKPYKYPNMYRGVDVLIINKIDLLPYIEFDMDFFRRGVELLNPGLLTFPLSCKSGEGLQPWFDWLRTEISMRRK